MGVTFGHEEVAPMLGAWAVDACDADEAAAVEIHIVGCSDCAREAAILREAAGWLGALEATTPPPQLEVAVLAAARTVRRPAAVAPSTAVQLMLHQADSLSALLASLRPGEWSAQTAAGWTVHELVGHLLAAASYLTWHLGLLNADPADGETAWVPRTEAVLNHERARRPEQTAAAWRTQADLLRLHVEGASEAELDRMIPWFDLQAPFRVLAVVNAFETWVHAEDIRRATWRRPQPPSAADLACMSTLAVALLTQALRQRDDINPGQVRLVLTGGGGGDWKIPVGHGAGDETAPTVTLAADVVEFCTLIGGRLRPDELVCSIEGEIPLAQVLLETATSFAFP